MLSPTAPSAWPWKSECERIEHTQIRDRLLDDAWEADLHGFLKEIWGPRKIGAVGIVDFSWNGLRVLCEQLSMPGLYGQRGTIHAPEGGEELTGIGGLMDGALWAPIMQDVEYRTRGLGDMFVRTGIVDGRLCYRPVKPFVVHVETDPREPTRAVALRELQCFLVDGEDRWAWECFELAGPRWWVEDAEKKDRLGQPLRITNLTHPGSPAEGLSGDAYPWRYVNGAPFIPYVHYRSRMGAGYWSHMRLRGLHRGTFHAARLVNTSLYAADCAAQKAVVALNCAPAGRDLKNAGAKGAAESIEILPGTVLPFYSDAGDQVLIQEIGPGADVQALWTVTRSMLLSMLAAHGLRESDVVRAEGNPTSAAALVISDSSRREAQRQLAPIFAVADRELIRQSAALLRLEGLGDYPEEGYQVEYAMIARSAGELQAERDEESFELEQGLLSRVQLYMQRRGVDRDTAVRALARIQQDAAEVEAAAGGAPATVSIEVGKAEQVRQIVADVRAGLMAPDVAQAMLVGVYGLPPELAATLARDTAPTSSPDTSSAQDGHHASM